eukprot:5274278-Amphidinium_carterae.1
MDLKVDRQERHDVHTVTTGVSLYMLCSSLALVANKMVMDYLKAPASIFCLQIIVTVLFIKLASMLDFIKVDAMRSCTCLAFLPYIASFTLTLYTNGKALSLSNVETVIVFRACAPLLVCFLDWCFLGRELPNARSLVAMLGMIVGAISYVRADSEFALSGVMAYKWVIINLLGVVFEMVYGKALLQGIQMESPVWGAVYYTNLLSLVPMLLLAVLMQEHIQLQSPVVSDSGFIEWLLNKPSWAPPRTLTPPAPTGIKTNKVAQRFLR